MEEDAGVARHAKQSVQVPVPARRWLRWFRRRESPTRMIPMQVLTRSPKSGHTRLEDALASPDPSLSVSLPSRAVFTAWQSPVPSETEPFRRKQRASRWVLGLSAGVVFILFIMSIVATQVVEKDDSSAAVKWTPPTRIRRSWKAFSDEDKKLYLRAVQTAMESGLHYRFVEIHTARMNRITSHGSCPFLLWHRRFILAYENMLRSLAPEFANLTLPYWNYFEDTNHQLAANVSCDSLESCSQFLRDMGGGGLSDGPMNQSMQVGHLTLRIGSCVSKGIAGHACNHPNGTASGQCANCIMRGNWTNPRKIVQTLGTDLLRVLDVYNRTDGMAVGSDAYSVVSREIETTFHNAIHTTLNSTMRYTSSAFDPVFMGHHGMVDLAQLIFNRCKHVANASVVIDWDAEPRDTKFDVFDACAVEDRDTYVYTAVGNNSMQMTMYDVPVENDAVMSQFFGGYGDTYRDIANAEDLGPDNSYTYAIDSYLENLLTRHNVRCPDYLFASNRGGLGTRRLQADKSAAMKLVDTLASCGQEVADRHPTLTYQQRLEQEGLVKCLVVEQRSGGVLEDYDSAFREMMQLQDADSPYCVQLLRRYRRGQLEMLASDACLAAYGEETGVDLLRLRRIA